MGTAFNPPQIYHPVQRQRLFRLFDENFFQQNILVVGQAAQGKSTLVASYLANKNHPVLWFRLSAEDNNHATLFEKLTQGLASMDELPVRLKEMTVPRATLGVKEEGRRHLEALSIVFRGLETRVTIVMDDLQALDETASGFSLVRRIVDLDHEKLILILLSRSYPGFELARLKMGRHLFVIDNENLAFTYDETRDFFNETGVGFPIDVEKIYRITEGWAGGLTLVSESIRQMKNLSRLPDRLSADVFGFFSQEIYNRLDASIRDFLLKVSILETIDLEAVNHLAGTRDGLDILLALEKRNLFVQRIHSDVRQSEFRFHDLFRNFLLKELKAVHGEEGVKALNLKAGGFFWDKKDHEQAVNYFINARSFPDIIRIIRIKGTDYIIKGRLSEPERWISHLPEEMISDDPWLIFFQTMTRRIKGGHKNITRLKQALSLFEQEKELRGILLCTGYLIEAAVFIRLPSNKILGWIQKGEQVLKQTRTSHRYPWARALLWQQIGLGYIAGDGNIPKGISACRSAVLLAQQIQNTELVLNATVTMTFGLVQAGDFARARQMLARVEHMAPKDRNPEYRALKSLVDIELALKNGEFKTARHLLEVSEKDIETFGLIFLYPGYVEEKACYLVYTAQYKEARQMAEHLNDFSILEGNDFYSSISCRIKAMIDLYRQEYAAALVLIREAVTRLDKNRKGDIHYYLAQQMEGVLLCLNQSHQQAEKVLLPVLTYFLNISSDLSACETAIALGLALWEQGKEKKGMAYLQQGFEKACANRYAFFPMLNDSLLSKAILYVSTRMHPQTFDDYILFLTARCDRQTVLFRMKRVMNTLAKKETIKVKEKFRPLYKQLLPKLQISSLGRFAVHRKSRSPEPVLFEGARPVLLLKAIVRHGARDIPKEILIDDLWPDADAESGEKKFKVTLHRLRKAMEPVYEKQFGYAYVLQKTGLISLDPHLVQIDAEQFMTMSKKGLKAEQRNQPGKALGYYKKAMALYKGDYFAEALYMEWIHRKRDLYRTRFMEILERKAGLHEELDQPDEAIDTWQAAIQTDPCFEKAYQNLMILYADSGRKSVALEVFEDCRKILDRELGARPDNQTLQIYNRVRIL